MSYPILYEARETNFDHNGIGILSDCISCFVTEEANGAFELEMKYPMDGIHYDKITDHCLIVAKPNQDAKPQAFRVYSISKPMSGIVSISAEHISYDLTGIPVGPFVANTAKNAMINLKHFCIVSHNFNFDSDMEKSGAFVTFSPNSARSILGGIEGSILDVYGGEYEFDNFNVILHEKRGNDNGVSIRYGKNLTDIKQERNCANVATGVYPYWVDPETSEILDLPENVVNAEGNFDIVRIKTLDTSSFFDYRPKLDEIRGYAKAYMESVGIGIPEVSLDVSFKQLEQTEEYKGMALLEKVSLFDTVSVDFPALGVSTKAKAVTVVYDVILDRVDSITLGTQRKKISDTVAFQKRQIETQQTQIDDQQTQIDDQQQQIDDLPTTKDMEEIAEEKASTTATEIAQQATEWLTNGEGYMQIVKKSDGTAQEVWFVDNVSNPKKILRIGQSGIGFSDDGGVSFDSAWTLDGNFIADNFHMTGTFDVYNDGKEFVGRMGYMQGSTPEKAVTHGVCLKSADGNNYIILTDAGARLQAGGSAVYINTDGTINIDGDFKINGYMASWVKNSDGTYTLKYVPKSS